MRDGDWEEAIALFDQALQEDGGLSEAYFYKGKCILRIYEVDLTEVWNDINPEKEDSNAVPFLFKLPPGRSLDDDINAFFFPFLPAPRDTAHTLIDSVFLERKRIYDAVCKAIVYLDTINSHPEMMDGIIKREQYESDYLVEISVKTVLSMVDLNQNNVLEYNSDEKRAYKILVQDIPSLEPDSMVLDSLKNISRNPQDINSKIDSLLAGLGKADSSYDNFAEELARGAEESAKIDPDMAKPLGDVIAQFKKVLPWFRYKNKRDDDTDFFNTCTILEDTLTADDVNDSTIIRLQNGSIVRMDPMIWVDWDGDDHIDINDPSQSEEHIGDPTHMADHPELYQVVDGPDEDYHRYRYIGPYTYEFIAGDWGVDEEILDGADNDQDGITDEDSRAAADTLDDERADQDDTTRCVPLVWSDDDGDLVIDNPAEVKSGSITCDEEWYDGVDNDRDGEIDEDVGERIPPESARAALIDSLR